MLFWALIVYCAICYLLQIAGALAYHLQLVDGVEKTGPTTTQQYVVAATLIVFAPIITPLLVVWLIWENRNG